MSWRKTILLGIIFAIIVFGYWQFEVKGRKEKEKSKAESARLLRGIDRIKKFRIETRSDVVEVSQDTSSKQWQVIAPVIYPADNDEVQKVLKSALEARYTEVVSDSADPRKYGLSPVPWVKFTAEGKTFILGEETPTHSGVYAQIEGDPRILLVPTDTRNNLLKVSFDLRDKSILPNIDIADIDSVYIAREKDTLKIVRKGLKWHITSPIEAEGDNKFIDRTLRNIIGMKATEFAAEEHSDSIMKTIDAKPSGEVTFYTKSGTSLKAKFFAKYEKNDTTPEFIYAYTPDKKPLFEISEHIWELTKKEISQFRNHSLAAVDECDSFKILGTDNFVVSAKRIGDQWELTNPDTIKGDKEQIERFLRNFKYSRIDSFKNDGKFKYSGWRFAFYTAGDSTVYLIGDTIGSRIQLKQYNSPKEYYLVNKTNIFKWCKPDWKKFASYRLLELDANAVKKMNITVGDKKYIFERGKPKWKAKTPNGTEKVPFYRVRRAMDEILKLSYIDTYPDTVRWDENTAELRAEIVDTSGNDYYIAIGEIENGEKISIVSGKNVYFKISGSAFDRIKNKLDEVVKKNK
ncbi:hypothetical protein DRQ26_00250 [bacterium]|nr:MAG: hypothetical protein DRQ26_00250 [bacterium]